VWRRADGDLTRAAPLSRPAAEVPPTQRTTLRYSILHEPLTAAAEAAAAAHSVSQPGLPGTLSQEFVTARPFQTLKLSC